jgi:ComF family protein
MERWLQSLLHVANTLLFPARDKERQVATLSLTDISHLPRAYPYDETYIVDKDCETHALFSYKNTGVQALIWELKYHRNTEALALVGALLADAITDELSDRALFENWHHAVLVPIPTSAQRLREKQFSQTDLLCRAIFKHLDHAHISYTPKALCKILETEKQNKTKSREQRLINVQNAFEADDTLVVGKNIILIDDVTTTGATIREAVRALKTAHARHIIAFTIAH